MSKPFKLKGQCVCGDVQISAKSEKNSVGACHCRTCRRWSGGPFMEVNCRQAVTFDGEEHISVFDSSDWAERGFCSECGTHLFYRLKPTGHFSIPAALFDGLKNLKLVEQLFIESKPDYYDFSNQTKMITGEALFAMFEDQQDKN